MKSTKLVRLKMYISNETELNGIIDQIKGGMECINERVF